MAAVCSEFESLTSSGIQDEALGISECASDDDFIHVQVAASQKGTAMAALSSIFQSEKAIDGDWVALSSPAMKVQALEGSNSPPGLSEEKSENAAPRDFFLSRTLSYRNLRTTSTEPAPDVDPTKRETYLSEEEFGPLFGMSKSQFYALPKWKQEQRKQDLDLF